ncbi:MAG TPA: serine/threonine-protein kinase, partial [Ilumatobacteraceae bacterium]
MIADPSTGTPKGARVLAGRYALDELVAVGGSAEVHRGTDLVLERPVAVKVLDVARVETADPSARRRFAREARTSARFTHPNAISVYDAGEDGDSLFLVLEYVDGQSLAHRLASGGPLPVHEAVHVAAQVLAALDAAHAVGIVHRDVKPANILVRPDGVAKLADFGIAQRFDDLSDVLTAAGTVVGTPRYLAPEQARGDAVTPATDLYAVGIVMYEMLAGQLPSIAGAAAPSVARVDADLAALR